MSATIYIVTTNTGDVVQKTDDFSTVKELFAGPRILNDRFAPYHVYGMIDPMEYLPPGSVIVDTDDYTAEVRWSQAWDTEGEEEYDDVEPSDDDAQWVETPMPWELADDER